MSDVVGYPVEILNARASVTWPRLNGGHCRLYTEPRPSTNGGEITTQTLLVEYALPDPVGTISDGVFTANPIEAGLILAEGSPVWCRCADNAGSAVCDMDVGISGSASAVEVDNLVLTPGAYLTITSFVVVEG